ncbi:MAG: PilZ domain-containing protein [Acidobacteriota bacterium]
MDRIPRSEGRFKKNLTASVRYKERVFSCITKNISRTGIYLEAIGLNLNSDRNVSISLVGEDSLFKLGGEIIWNRSIPSEQGLESIEGLGIKITDAPSDYLNFVEYQRYL